MTEDDACIKYPEWCDTEDKKEKYRDWLDIQWTFRFLDRCLKNQEVLEITAENKEKEAKE